MMKKREGIDIVSEIGGITTIDAAVKLFEEKMDTKNLQRINEITNTEVLIKVANAIAMCRPDSVFVNTGSDADRQFIRDLSLEKGEEAKLPMEGHTIHFDLKEEQGRIIDRTYYFTNPDDLVSSLANKVDRAEALEDIRGKMVGIMAGKIMIVGFYIRGPGGAPVSNPALEITSSTYVSHSAEILYRNAFSDFNDQVERLGHYYTNIHSEGLNRPEDLPSARVYICLLYTSDAADDN